MLIIPATGLRILVVPAKPPPPPTGVVQFIPVIIRAAPPLCNARHFNPRRTLVGGRHYLRDDRKHGAWEWEWYEILRLDTFDWGVKRDLGNFGWGIGSGRRSCTCRVERLVFRRNRRPRGDRPKSRGKRDGKERKGKGGREIEREREREREYAPSLHGRNHIEVLHQFWTREDLSVSMKTGEVYNTPVGTNSPTAAVATVPSSTAAVRWSAVLVLVPCGSCSLEGPTMSQADLTISAGQRTWKEGRRKEGASLVRGLSRVKAEKQQPHVIPLSSFGGRSTMGWTLGRKRGKKRQGMSLKQKQQIGAGTHRAQMLRGLSRGSEKTSITSISVTQKCRKDGGSTRTKQDGVLPDMNHNNYQDKGSSTHST
ncbi:hypothetical protein FB45DRAFT_861943 [Roridomyces roridus]|uniref:Uncharacterized protein n=1 Tax=Roridomyces roridus TaxID=1738132 RepID=A0AAD7FV94_9AGAR|nr:hypothetical protein FB45DRAFT_861943 [Roridomyces roridus]